MTPIRSDVNLGCPAHFHPQECRRSQTTKALRDCHTGGRTMQSRRSTWAGELLADCVAHAGRARSGGRSRSRHVLDGGERGSDYDICGRTPKRASRAGGAVAGCARAPRKVSLHCRPVKAFRLPGGYRQRTADGCGRDGVCRIRGRRRAGERCGVEHAGRVGGRHQRQSIDRRHPQRPDPEGCRG